ncbi:MAG: hypothetical protein R2837_01335 [Aliarcobacter sp.]|uniref:Membrane protein n=1 Tax=Arcobacter aquimarinus TaxID=1315211 RepID=A0AAE7B4K9_9BACT|nr:hypothetical protein [Arcobacter aquimarinus]QKE25287.1 putative membrane protein [Arcobacter aquimarinus]RXI36699.1 hypothetical protein CP986_01040 [Arcobacter aquimarinus]
MGLKKYIAATIIFLVVVFGYTYSLELGSYEASLLGYSLSLPISVWIVFPAAVLVLVTYLHIVFYGLINYFKQRAVLKDHESMIEFVKAELLEKNNTVKFRTKEFKNLSSILNQFKISTKDERFTSSNEDLNKIVGNIQDINDGKFVNDKSFKVNETTKLANLNMLNKVNEQIDFAVDVLKKPENYSSNVVKQAFENVLREKSMTTVKKLYKNIKLDKEQAFKLFEKDASNNEFGFTPDEILQIVKSLDFTKDDYLVLAKNYEKILKPDQIIALFEKLSSEIDEATTAYLHVLCEYEMIEKVKEIVTLTPDNEFAAFKALLDLKDAGKHYNLEAISYK